MEKAEMEQQLKTLYVQVQDICGHFKQIRGEASDIIEKSKMPETTRHLEDVLEESEKATVTIMQAASAINEMAENNQGISKEAAPKVMEQIGLIYEAAAFQDIGGQRIKKVIAGLKNLEARLNHIASAARGEVNTAHEDELRKGPAASGEAPSQEEVDKLFGS